MTQYNVTGMSCAACSARVEKAVNSVDGVTSCAVSLLTNSMGVEGTASPDEIIKAVTAAGYGASLKDGTKKEATNSDELKDTETPKLIKRLVASVVFLIPLMYISMGHMMWGWPLPHFMDNNHVAMGLAQMLFAIIIMVINQKFFISGFKGLINKSPNMDTLIAIGSGASFLYSTYSLFAMTVAQTAGDSAKVMSYMDGFYFESAAMILTLITVGKTLESYSKGRTTDALKGLLSMAPKTATIIRDGAETEVPTENVQIGDIFAVKPGESIPVDGVIIDGETAIDESAITGESIPVDKTEGDSVTAATINSSGYIKCRAVRVGEDTTFSQIIKMVSDASATKAPIAKVADKVSGVFVPVVMCIAVVTFVIWLIVGQKFGYALSRGVSVLVISCPCALGLATPVAVMVGNGMGAKNGILFKTAAALEATGKAQIVAVDKTGTVTLGQPKITDIVPCDNISDDELLSVAYALEKKSEHPLAKAITDAAQQKNISLKETEEFSILAGNGLKGVIDNKTVIGGSYAFVSGVVDFDNAVTEKYNALAEQGKTPMFFARDNKLLGIIAVADVIKEDSPRAIKELRDMGIKTVMLTGDNKRTADAIGRQVGVDTVISEVLPNEKESVIRRLSEYGKVAMVGDGINDAPALTRADIGMAINTGTDIAADAADVVLMNSSLSDVSAAIRLSRATLTNIHENLFWAFIYNIIGIPLAAGVWIPIFGWTLNPMFGAAAMSLSSFCVVTNALRLNFFKIHKTKNVKKIKPVQVDIKEIVTMKKTVKIEGMMCPHCEAAVKKSLEAVDGVETATPNHETDSAEITFTTSVDDEKIKKAVEDAGYKYIG